MESRVVDGHVQMANLEGVQKTLVAVNEVVAAVAAESSLESDHGVDLDLDGKDFHPNAALVLDE